MSCYLLHHLICAVTGLTLNWLVTPGNVDEGQFMVPMLAKTLADGFKAELLAVDNGYSHCFNYEIPNFLGAKVLIGFRGKNKFGWRGKPKTLRLRFRKMIKAGKLTAQKLAEIGMQLDPYKNSLEDVVCALSIAGQHLYVGAFFRNQSLAWFRRDKKGWLSLMLRPAASLRVRMGT